MRRIGTPGAGRDSGGGAPPTKSAGPSGAPAAARAKTTGLASTILLIERASLAGPAVLASARRAGLEGSPYPVGLSAARSASSMLLTSSDSEDTSPLFFVYSL